MVDRKYEKKYFSSFYQINKEEKIPGSKWCISLLYCKSNLNHLNILVKELECPLKDFLPEKPVL